MPPELQPISNYHIGGFVAILPLNDVQPAD